MRIKKPKGTRKKLKIDEENQIIRIRPIEWG